MKKFTFCFTTTHNDELKAFRLKESQPCFDYTSNSAILSISAFLISHFPKLRPPTVTPQQYSLAKLDELL
jgi:hypothetical protein